MLHPEAALMRRRNLVDKQAVMFYLDAVPPD